MSTEKISKTSTINNNIDHDQISPINGGDIKKNYSENSKNNNLNTPINRGNYSMDTYEREIEFQKIFLKVGRGL